MSALLDGPAYAAYLYSYPHKNAYRRLDPEVPLAPLWARERRQALFLYVHVPFCEMRCGFCNLFTTARPPGELVTAYLAALARQARRVRDALDAGGAPFRFAGMAIGGGTPTLLERDALAGLLDLTEGMGAALGAIPISVETSPETAAEDTLRLLVERGVGRISIGVQSFVAAETHAVNRPQDPAVAHLALERIRAAGAPVLNVDLMYGIPGQTAESWLASLAAALCHAPEEIYLYPLYVRPLTGLGRRERAADGDPADDVARLRLYRVGRDFLIARGYAQVSMRMFRAAHAPALAGPVYRCQEDGMVGLGCGARSYTEELHYSSEYAVGARGVRGIIDAYVRAPDEAFAVASHGIRLDDEERRRRFVALSLLSDAGLDLEAYRRRFDSAALADLPQLEELPARGLAEQDGDRLQLTAAGVERSDAIGPWLASARVRALMDGYEAR